MSLTRRSFLLAGSAPLLVGFAQTTPFAAYCGVWQRLEAGQSVARAEIVGLLRSPDEFDERLEQHGDGKLWGVFTSCTPSADVLFDFLLGGLCWLVSPDSPDLPVMHERGQAFAWYWSYWGRAALAMWQATGDERFQSALISAAKTIMAVRGDKLGVHDDLQKRVVKAWPAVMQVNGEARRFSEITASGLITLPLLQAAKAIPQVEEWRSELIATLHEFDEQFAEGFYHAPGRPGAPDAFNHMAAFGAALAQSGDPVLSERAAEILAFLRRHTTRHWWTGTVSWPYMLGERTPETFWKAAVTVELPLALLQIGHPSVKLAEVQAIAETWRKVICASPDVLCSALDPSQGQSIDLRTDFDRIGEELRSLVPSVMAGFRLREFASVADPLTGYLINHPRWFRHGLFGGSRIGALILAEQYALGRMKPADVGSVGAIRPSGAQQPR